LRFAAQGLHSCAADRLAHYCFCALQEPPPFELYQLPDIDVPDFASAPEYVAPTPTAPNLIVLPFTLPLIPYRPRGLESVIDPVSAGPACVQWSVNVPDTTPL
jgi:hypothetical protein